MRNRFIHFDLTFLRTTILKILTGVTWHYYLLLLNVLMSSFQLFATSIHNTVSYVFNASSYFHSFVQLSNPKLRPGLAIWASPRRLWGLIQLYHMFRALGSVLNKFCAFELQILLIRIRIILWRRYFYDQVCLLKIWHALRRIFIVIVVKFKKTYWKAANVTVSICERLERFLLLNDIFIWNSIQLRNCTYCWTCSYYCTFWLYDTYTYTYRHHFVVMFALNSRY